MSLWSSFFGQRSQSEPPSTPADFEHITIAVHALMTVAMLLVSLPTDPVMQIRRRQRIAACAFGAADWMHQNMPRQMSEPDWMQFSFGITAKYFMLGDSCADAGVDPEAVGKAIAEVVTGQGDLPDCMRVGAMSLRDWLSNSSEGAPARVSRCVMEWNEPPLSSPTKSSGGASTMY